MCDEVLQHVFKSVVISRMCYASSAWLGFTMAADRQHLEAFICHQYKAICVSEFTDIDEHM